MNTITLRKALVDDIPMLKFWDTQEHVIKCHSDDVKEIESDDWDTVIATPPDHTDYYITQLGEIPIGVMQIIDPALEESHYWGNVETNLKAVDIWIGEKENLNKGYGTQMMNLACEVCFRNPNVKEIIIDPLTSNINAIRFYERFGFSFVEKRMFEEDACSVYKLERDKWLKKSN
jgi:aminoglycoside 6'-N-acetyltransferase